MGSTELSAPVIILLDIVPPFIGFAWSSKVIPPSSVKPSTITSLALIVTAVVSSPSIIDSLALVPLSVNCLLITTCSLYVPADTSIVWPSKVGPSSIAA
ncbi:hypothetical protein ES705_39856 [subsurface metagenome]